ncbi:MAG TPA: heparan-alpha-glucosaminide N-acetyltransferase domain-containing protein [Kofleriaceae bacterium]|nr:heparan-alpha-glucosaminide N-acetyltransferase domain-containing protein [Kofleriaceae bacterium]
MRVRSIDVLRGLAVALMVIDHVRVFSGVPAGGATPGVFFTRWVTHFCAPAFVFLAGASAYLYARTHRDLPRFLVVRGLWLIVLEATIVRLSWTFNLDFGGHGMAGVLWVLGASMIALAVLTRLPPWLVGALGVAIIAGHNLFDARLAAIHGPVAWPWKLLYVGFYAGPIELGDGPRIQVLYSLVPWVGVMAAGYGFGAILVHPRRDRCCAAIGLAAIALFIVLRALDGYGDLRPWSTSPKPGYLAFLDVTKYPASLDLLLVTLGPLLAAVPLAERAHGPIARWLATLGRVPLFFYLLHIPLVHALAIAVAWMRGGAVDPWLFTNHPMANPPPPAGYAWSLPLLYVVVAVALALLTLACQRYAAYKQQHPDGWLRFL